MGYSHLVHAALALTCLLAASMGAPVAHASPWWLLPCAGVPHLLGWAARREFFRGRHRRGVYGFELLRHAPLVLHAFAVLGCAWGERMQAWSGSELLADGQWPRAGLLLGLAPWLGFELLSVDAQARFRSATRAQIADARGFELRMRAAALTPLALMCAASLALGWNEEWRVRTTYVGILGALFATAMLAAMLLCVPSVLRWVWGARPLDRPLLRAALDEVAALADFRCAAVLEWRTGGRIANAAILGIGPRTRIVVFTDALIDQLGLRELRAVYAHEIGHAKSHHLLTFAAWTIALLVGGGWLAETVLPSDEWWSMLALLPLIGLWFVLLGWLSRRFELEADLHALRVLGEPHALIHALERVTGVHAHDKDSWRHFSSKRRIEFLLRIAEDPSAGTPLRRMLRGCRIAGLCAGLAVAGARGTELATHWSEDMAWTDLRLGQYERAPERRARSADGRLEVLVALAATLPADAASQTAERLVELAAQGYDAADFGVGRAWLELAALRGDVRAIELTALDDEIGAELDIARAPGIAEQAPEPQAQSWRQRLLRARAVARDSAR